MKETKVALRYAKSLIGKAESDEELHTLYKDMQNLIRLHDEYRDFRIMLHSPVIKTDQKINVIKRAFAEEISEDAMEFLFHLCKKRREAFLKTIAKTFLDLYKKKKNILTAEVTTAIEMEDDLREKVLKAVRKEEGQEVDLIEKVKEEIIGGVILKVGDMQYDGSVKKQLATLKTRLK